MSVVKDKKRADVRLALSRKEAAEALGMSLNSFARYVQPELPALYRGSLVVFPVKAIEEWLEKNAAIPIAEWGGER